jgi:hypothetical protein
VLRHTQAIALVRRGPRFARAATRRRAPFEVNKGSFIGSKLLFRTRVSHGKNVIAYLQTAAAEE